MKLNLQKKEDYHIYFLLRKKFNGFEDIVKKIINIKNEDLINEIRNEYIERDFYNWLNCDLLLRSETAMGKNEGCYISYYLKNHNELCICPYDSNNINNSLRRKKGLNTCFNSDWWKTTSKSRIDWKIIHESIINTENVNFYIWKLEREYLNEDIINFDINNWREPSITERCRVNNEIYYYKIIVNIDMECFYNGRLLLTRDLRLIV
jgi:hypothetical protein